MSGLTEKQLGTMKAVIARDRSQAGLVAKGLIDYVEFLLADRKALVRYIRIENNLPMQYIAEGAAEAAFEAWEALSQELRNMIEKRIEMSGTKPDIHCVIEELYDLEVLPFGWVLLKRANKNNPDYIGIKYLGGLDPLARIAELETENKLLKKKHHPDCNVFISISQDMPEPPYCTCGYEQLEAELADIGHRLSCVLDHATGGRMSKTSYTKEAMYAEIDSYYQNLCDEENKELKTELDTERSMRHEAQSDYGNLMEKTEALEAEVRGLMNVKISYEEDHARYAEEITNLCGQLDALDAQVAKQAQTIKDGHERQAQLATKLHDTEVKILKLWKACLEYLKAPPTNVPARKKLADLVTGGKPMPDAARKWLEKYERTADRPWEGMGHLRRLLTENEELRKFRCGWCGRSAGEEHGLHIVGAYAKEALDA